jgi:glycosyltransferase involved in cell wall biosynthesis
VVSDTPEQIEGVTAPDGEYCGKVVAVHDDRALAAAISGLLNNPADGAVYARRAERLGNYARWEVMLDAYERLTERNEG